MISESRARSERRARDSRRRRRETGRATPRAVALSGLVALTSVLALAAPQARALPGEAVSGSISYSVESGSTTIDYPCWLNDRTNPACYTENPTTIDEDDLPNFAAPFVATSTAPGINTSEASQDLSTGSASVTATGAHRADSYCSVDEIPPFTLVENWNRAESASTLRVEFDVEVPSDYVLSGSVLSLLTGTATSLTLALTSATITLETIGGSVVTTVASMVSDSGCYGQPTLCSDSQPLGASGSLAPGRYALIAEATGSAECANSTAGSTAEILESTFDLDLTITPTTAVPGLAGAGRAVVMAMIGVLGVIRLGIWRFRSEDRSFR